MIKEESKKKIPDRFIPPAKSIEYKTGGWRVGRKPSWDESKCTNCLLCWVYCPEKSIKVKDGKMVGIDLTFCKGCGICETECPTNAIEMVKEKVL